MCPHQAPYSSPMLVIFSLLSYSSAHIVDTAYHLLLEMEKHRLLILRDTIFLGLAGTQM